MIWLFKNDEAKAFPKDAVPKLLADGWSQRRPIAPKPAPESAPAGGTGQAPQTGQEPATSSAKAEGSAVLYRIASEELVKDPDSNIPMTELTYDEDIFPDAEIEQRISEGWFKDLDDAKKAFSDNQTDPATKE